MLFATASSNQIALGQDHVQSTQIVEAASAAVLASSGLNQIENTEAYVKTYFAKTPILAEVARCESRYHQFTKSGDVIRGMVDSDDIGVMQINERYNGVTAKNLGFDIYTLDGNLAFGQWMYDHQGTQPWSASEPCWGK